MVLDIQRKVTVVAFHTFTYRLRCSFNYFDWVLRSEVSLCKAVIRYHYVEQKQTKNMKEKEKRNMS